MEVRGRLWTPLQFITNGRSIEQTLLSAQMALDGGCRWIQLRMKEGDDSEVEAAALALRAMCRMCGAVLVVDDRVELARDLGLDGVHLGLNDMPISQARGLLGGGAIIGGTANTLRQAEMQIAQGADYLGIGPFRFTETKKNLSPVIGAEGYRTIMADLRQRHSTPVVAIGGITLADADEVMAAGVDGIAVSGAILRARNPVLATRQWCRRLGEAAED